MDDFVGDLSVSQVRGSRGVRATERRHAHGRSSSPCFATGCTLASKTVRSVLCPSGGGPGRRDNEEVHVFEAKEASDDEWEAEYPEAVAMMTVARQRRAEVNRARQFFREPQSLEGRKAQFDKLKQKLPCARCGQLGHRKDDNDCPATVKTVDWRKPKPFQFLHSPATFFYARENAIRQCSRCRGASPR